MMTRRDFGLLASSGIAAVAVDGGTATTWGGEAVDVSWRSNDPHLSGNFLPVRRETDAMNLTVREGRIPPELSGAYMRNGPNPEFQPIGYAYPLDGDGMIHAVYLGGGRARYRNRFVRTDGLTIERRAGHAVYGSFTRPVPIDPAVLRPGDSSAPIKNGAFINVIRHGNHLLALNEATTCYEMSNDLETIGQWTAGGAQPIRMGAHNRRHPHTGDLYSLEYTWRAPTVRFHRIDPSGVLVSTVSLDLPMPTMIHDFILTERHIVLIAGPAVFDVKAAQAGQSMLQWRPELGMRIAVLPLAGGPPRWIDGEPFFVYHFANGFERGQEIVVDYVHHEKFAFVSTQPPTFRRMTIDLAAGSFRTTQFSDIVTEFPRVNHLREALPTRYAYMPTLTATFADANPAAATFNAMVKFDTETGGITHHDFGNKIVGEGAFVPRPGGTREDDGYIAVFLYDPAERSSSFVLLDAGQIDAPPVVVIALPQRVPQGLHGNWLAGA